MSKQADDLILGTVLEQHGPGADGNHYTIIDPNPGYVPILPKEASDESRENREKQEADPRKQG